MIRNSILIVAVVFCGIVHGQVADNTPIIEASGLSITKAEFEAMLKGDSKYSAAFAQPAGKKALGVEFGKAFALEAEAVSYTHLTLRRIERCRSRWSPYH